MSKQVIAVYIRLSQADEDTGKEKDESDSIVNQRSLIHGFLDRNEELSGLSRVEFVDDGYSGTNADRPAFMEMMSKMREGLFSVCISKDFSRIFRDYIEMGECIEKTFPSLHVRYISINDHYDSDDYKGTTGGIDVVMKNIIYSAYSRDISVKVKSAKIQSARKGRRPTGFPPYGYSVDPDNKGMDIIDPEASKVVRRIFDEALSGHSSCEIAKMLNREGIDPPGIYFRKKYPGKNKFPGVSDNSTWRIGAVRTILDRFTYTGASVYGKSSVIYPCSKKHKVNKNEDIIIVKGVHKAIITEEEYDRVQTMKYKCKKEKNSSILYPLKSLVICGSCGRAMRRSDSKTRHFFCSHKYEVENSPCSNIVSLPEEKLEKIIYDEICRFIELAGMNKEKLKNRMTRDRSCINKAEDKIRSLKVKMEKLKDERLKVYERFVSGELSKDSYLKEKNNLNEEFAAAEAKVREEEMTVRVLMSEEKSVCSKVEANCKAYMEEDHLTYEMAHAFVDKIFIYAEDRIEIKWRFRDFFADKIREIQEQSLLTK